MASDTESIHNLSADDYLSIGAPSEGLYKDNGSRFISFAYPCNSSDKAEELVKALRKEYRLTQEDLAYKSGVGLRFIREMEQGKQTLRMDKVNQVLNLFNMELGPVATERRDD